jgi:Fic family protein
MTFTEIKRKNKKAYYYRVRSIRGGKKVGKERIYMGVDLGKKALAEAEKKADTDLGMLDGLLTDSEKIELERIKKEYIKTSKSAKENRYEAFVSQFTHDSTAIEGNTLTLQETAGLLFDSMVPSLKPLREINEILNHKRAFDHMIGYDADITKAFVLELHRLILTDTVSSDLSEQIGRYRSLQVYIRGVEWTPPPPEEVSREMTTLLRWYSRNKKKLHPLILAAYFHVGFELVHPFVDGNGRVGRLLLNFILHKNGYPMINIPLLRKLEYYDRLEKAQVEGELRPFVEFLLDILRKTTVKL